MPPVLFHLGSLPFTGLGVTTLLQGFTGPDPALHRSTGSAPKVLWRRTAPSSHVQQIMLDDAEATKSHQTLAGHMHTQQNWNASFVHRFQQTTVYQGSMLWFPEAHGTSILSIHRSSNLFHPVRSSAACLHGILHTSSITPSMLWNLG